MGMTQSEQYQKTAADFDYAIRAELHSEAGRLARKLKRLDDRAERTTLDGWPLLPGEGLL